VDDLKNLNSKQHVPPLLTHATNRHLKPNNISTFFRQP